MAGRDRPPRLHPSVSMIGGTGPPSPWISSVNKPPPFNLRGPASTRGWQFRSPRWAPPYTTSVDAGPPQGRFVRATAAGAGTFEGVICLRITQVGRCRAGVLWKCVPWQTRLTLTRKIGVLTCPGLTAVGRVLLHRRLRQCEGVASMRGWTYSDPQVP